MQIEAFSTRSATLVRKTGTVYTLSLHGLIHISQRYFQAIFYRDLGFFFYFLHPFKESNVSSSVDTVNLTIFQKVIASRVYLYIYLAVVKIVF